MNDQPLNRQSIEVNYLRPNALFLLIASIVAIFMARSLLAVRFELPRLFNLFDALTVVGSVAVVLKTYSRLKLMDWLIAASLGGVVGVGMLFATLYSAYPFFGIVHSQAGQAWVRGVLTFLAALGGLAIMRQGGPIHFPIANREFAKAGRGLLIGLMVGLPLAVINVFALQFSQRQAIAWQSPLAAVLDALQPALVEEVIYRFVLWGLLWILLRHSMPQGASWVSGMLALLIHNYAHFDELFIQSPLVALAMGLVIGIVWGLPPTLLARLKGLEAAIAFHWVQDVARFLAGF